MKTTVRCVDGPYAGQTVSVQIPWPVEYETGPWRTDFVAAPLCWIVNGADWHGYQLRAQGATRHTCPHSFHLVFVRTVRPAGTVTAAEYGDEPYERLPGGGRTA